jgi:hypothetical protein
MESDALFEGGIAWRVIWATTCFHLLVMEEQREI